MIDNVTDRVKVVAAAFQSWIRDSSSGLSEAKARTVSEGFFPDHDANYSIQCFGRQVTESSLMSWIEEQLSGLPAIIPQKILCLHAGNLPMVGLQDVIACLVLGHKYYGKISRKDPYLIPSFLSYFKRQNPDAPVVWSTNLDDYRQLGADAVLFSGSEDAVPEVRKTLEQDRMVKSDTSYLIRTAHFSIAYLDKDDPAYLKALSDAVVRYEGKGCRSVAIIVSPLSLRSQQCHLTDYFEAFWTANPEIVNQNPKLRYRMAYNKAIDRSQAMLDKFLIEESDPDLEENVIYWQQGGPELVRELSDRFREQVQNIYITGSHVTIPGFEDTSDRIDFLNRAQCPKISWKPDGIDVLKWLANLSTGNPP